MCIFTQNNFSMVYRLKTVQNLPISVKKAWDFLSDPGNLKTITPDYMGFKILEGAEEKMYAGQIIKYIVTPVLRLPLRWVTEITQVEDQKYFVDEQLFGPYSLWHHKHFIKAIPGGVEMIDIVDYKLPLGMLGRIAHPLFVKRQLNQIFNYRYNKLVELFGEFRD
jgi:ligand-binding SRPBCC domain-containing protein